MPAPTLGSSGSSNFVDTATSETTASVTWGSGDIVLVLGITGDNGIGMNTPTVTGLTFSLVTATSGVNPTNTASTCKAYAWKATAGSASSGAIVSTGISTPNVRGMFAWVFSGSGGVSACASSASGTGTTVSLARSGSNSAVVWIGGDFNATNDTTVAATPVTGGTQRVAQFSTGNYTAFAFDWSDEGTAGTTSYGITGFAGGTFTKLAVEVLGTGGSAPTVKQLAQLGVG